MQEAPHGCALFESGQIKCWGDNRYGQLGLGHSHNIGDGEQLSDVAFVSVGGRVLDLALGARNTCALLDGGAVKCWGDNEYGQLGQGNTDRIGDNESPSAIAAIALGEGRKVTQVAVGQSFACAVLSSGKVMCWGEGRLLGLAGAANIGDDELPSTASALNLGGSAASIVIKENSSCVILSGGTSDGRIRCWGHNHYGQLGLGHTKFYWR